ncbi:MAG: hypothetical protein VYE73_17725 [Acidobacteriota bacterium]|nr:hypothetical protein [Acidobacteriota bacterium]
MHHYKIAGNAIDAAVHLAAENGWSEQDALQSLIVSAVARHAGAAGAESTRTMLQFELSNLSGTADFDFVRSR